jgi:hypothetical protein
MPPLSDAVVVTLRTDPCAALAAIMIVANAHGELLAWAQRALNVGKAAIAEEQPPENGEGAGRNQPLGAVAKLKPRKAANPGVNGGDGAYRARRRAQRDADDERLIEAMGHAPGATIREWGAAIGKSVNATADALRRLRDAGLAESSNGTWALVKPQPATAPKWIQPLSASQERAHASA